MVMLVLPTRLRTSTAPANRFEFYRNADEARDLSIQNIRHIVESHIRNDCLWYTTVLCFERQASHFAVNGTHHFVNHIL